MQIDRRGVFFGAAAVAIAPEQGWAQSRDYAAAADYSAQRRGVSFLVMQGGRVLFEDYPRSSAGDTHELASGTKSFSGVLAAAMVQDGLLTLDEACADTLTEWGDDPVKRSATIRTLLSLSSGVGGGSIGRPSTYAASVAQPFAGAPGVFRYGPTPFQVFGEIVRRKLSAAGRPDDVLAFIDERLLRPAGVTHGSWRRQAGQANLPSGAQFNARNWARFGAFVQGGCRVEGRAIVDAQALADCFRPTPANPGYGLTWWLLRPGLVPPSPRSPIDSSAAALAGLPTVRMAAGAGDQRLYLIPDRDLVVVRQADGILARLAGGGTDWSDAAFLRLILN
ncbi:serine hydrolase domain-containing protein [Brevundimonas sp. UBA2416]|uniref:serine hydrolase domain-containing protein n=1 Tax=Brevundimonas sp. UBA2416 TaxID=1946124 RepID=UPI0025B8B5BB|nr:serine hydrolase [Brevundimonas sp. UBA2416]HRJ62865.1 serine hydrolase [Brevundimonas sp.]